MIVSNWPRKFCTNLWFCEVHVLSSFAIILVRMRELVSLLTMYLLLSYDVASGSDITPHNKIDKPLVVYRFW